MLTYLILYNNLFIGLQFVYKITLNIIGAYYLSFGLDGISLFFILLNSLLLIVCSLSSYEKPYKQNLFNSFLWLFQLIIFVFFTTSDIILFFVFFELSLIPIFLIILIWGSSTRRAAASFYLYVYTTIGALLMLFGVLIVVLETGVTNIHMLTIYNFAFKKQIVLFFLFFWGFSIKIPMFPFHLWLP